MIFTSYFKILAITGVVSLAACAPTNKSAFDNGMLSPGSTGHYPAVACLNDDSPGVGC
jgi:hypothetical protein